MREFETHLDNKNKNMKPKLIFTEAALPLILEALNLFTNEEGFICKKSTGELIRTSEGETIKENKFCGVQGGRYFKEN